jgi:GNAT superfamily N-acetyltransferase
MAALYNAETAFEPHIAPLTCDRFVHLVQAKSYFDASGLFLALRAGRLAGWVHACLAPGSEPWHDPARVAPRIRMLIYPHPQLSVGAALVAEATAWLRARADPPFLAFHAKLGYPFYRGLWLGGEPMAPATLPHVQLALEVAGYKNTQESICLTAELASPPRPSRPAVSIELLESPAPLKHEPMRESWIGFEPMTIQAILNHQQAGQIGWVLLPHVADRLGAPCVNIYALGVNQPHRRKGIAAALVARALQLGYRLGARFASVATQLWNAPAHATYAKFGFQPHCVLVGRTLDPTVAKSDSA